MQNLRGADVWSTAQYMNPLADMTVQDITDREAMQANTSLEKEQIMWCQLVPPNDHDQYYKLPPTASVHSPVRKQGLQQAVFSQSVKQTPGWNKLSFDSIRLCWKWDKERIVSLTKTAIDTGRQPAIQKWANSEAIRKPGTDDYTQLMAYRSISLLSFNGKLVQKLVGDLLLDFSRKMMASEGQTIWKQKRAVSHRCSGHDGGQSSCKLEKWLHTRHTSDGH